MNVNCDQQVQGVEVAGFIAKTFQILKNQQFSRIINWGPTGTQFIIKDISKFQQVVLPKYFRHNKINSFIRQLNMYGFHKSRKEHSKSIFSHPLFQKDRKDLLSQVKRKIKLDEQGQTQNFQTPTKTQKVKQDVQTAVTAKILTQLQPTQIPMPSLKQFNILETVNPSFMKLFESKQNFFSNQQLNFSLNKISQNCIGEVNSELEQKDGDLISIEQDLQDKQDRQKQISYLSNIPSITNFQNPSCFFNSFISKD